MINHNKVVSTLSGFLLTPLLLWSALPGKFQFWFLLPIALVPFLFWLDQAKSLKTAALRGFLCGFFLHIFLLYWIVSVLVTFGGIPWVGAVPLMLLLCCYMAGYLVIFSLLYFWQRTYLPGWLLFVTIPCSWVAMDWVRSWAFGGFPWMDLGYGLWSIPATIQFVDITGHYGATFLLLSCNLVIYAWISKKFSFDQRLFAGIFLILLIYSAFIYSWYRWKDVELKTAVAPRALIGVVQGNIKQQLKWSAEMREKTVEKYLNLTTELDAQGAELVVWPETAVPFYPQHDPLLKRITATLKPVEITLLTGAPWYNIVTGEDGKRAYEYFNSAQLIGSQGDFLGSYYKTQLVPYGEYVPFQEYLPFIKPLVESVGDFTPGTVEKTLETGPMRIGVLICYESIFEWISRTWSQNGANVFINLTNDAWYGKSSAPYQSWAMTVFRSVENRKATVRAANTGISGGIDPLGRIIMRSDLFVDWAQIVETPLLSERTFYNRVGFRFAPACAMVTLFALFGCLIWSRLRPKK
ncbi:MAG: apolipoprotein N-acyltransferase [Desulfobulbaceae bacterium]|nr:MAG: apolipoprotein N-acyltransferase [Desulfobulbaceae bacterium]